MDVLILGGTTKARQLATRLIGEGVSLCTSLAGRTKSPRPIPGPTRLGGFGGIDGLKEFLTHHEVKVMVDASHPFAATMHDHAARACRDLNLPLARLAPPSWRTQPEAASWHWVNDHDGAAQILVEMPDTILLTVGRQPISHYLPLGPRHVIVRCVDAPTEDLPDGWTVLQERGPFTLDREREIFSQGVATLVSKDSGGTDLDPKLTLAAQTGVHVVMVSRGSAPGWGDELSTIDDAVQWVRDHEPSSAEK
ncbi:cobalt-precorrin-6A reductase [Cutibacterium sp. WCA-380-WT-3A]|uniref:Cobalt-precorrin-6A reductase n=1 Tax=Cutibacterium porci TaxID=2605781 RepID=A0A7K0J591_9ACTN|nr:cobalt-precorrin-6A reductase [Cutibacterium porci]MSS45106.1 cobalt-precorrin-6A reductase [Cutibacterium porci]